MIKVFKFGGASVKDAAAVRNVGEILKKYSNEKIIIVVSAMGKTTNALEQVVKAYMNGEGNAHALLNDIKTYHLTIMEALFADPHHPVYESVNNFFVEVDWVM